MKELRKISYFLFATAMLVAVFVSTIFISPAHARKIEEIIVFGDSLSDTGNLYVTSNMTFPESPPYYNGRFSNGLVWVEYLALRINIEVPVPSNLGGTNYAWGGAETGYGLSARGTPNVGEQIKYFLGTDPENHNLPKDNQLFIVWAGSNDFNNTSGLLPDPQNLVKNITKHIETLALTVPETKLTFLVPNLPPLGQTARAHCLGLYYPNIPPMLDYLSVEFNTLLANELKELKRELKKLYSIKVKIFQLDIYALTQEMLMNPEVFGFINITDTARLGADAMGCPLDVTALNEGVVDNADEYLFFDDIHPSSTFHQVVAERALELIYEIDEDDN
ncbi:MAG: SGNH/GDSL hydrolase family protein [Desulfobacterales bacterium]|nr:SGNH/GDSL hydrolase family protein [Desulfobacterales bacterium]